MASKPEPVARRRWLKGGGRITVIAGRDFLFQKVVECNRFRRKGLRGIEGLLLEWVLEVLEVDIVNFCYDLGRILRRYRYWVAKRNHVRWTVVRPLLSIAKRVEKRARNLAGLAKLRETA